MEVIKPEVLALLQYLLPGFVAAWIYHRLIDLPRPAALDAVVQALIFTAIVQFLVAIEKLGLFFLSSHLYSFGVWNDDAHTVLAFLTAVVIGAISVRLTSADGLLFEKLRRFGFTGMASYPSEWFGAFKVADGYVALQLKDDRRLFGWVSEWPSSPERGHIRLQRASWLPTEEGGKTVALNQLSSILIRVDDVRWVEFLSAVSAEEK